MFDHETRVALAHDRHLQLQRDMQAAAFGRRRTRRVLGELMVALGERLRREAPQPCRELSFRA